jgi:osmoprotectant transport system permease protein
MEGIVKRNAVFGWIYIAIITGLFFYVIFNMELWYHLLGFIFPGEDTVLYPRADLAQLLKEHIILVSASSVAAVIVGVTVGIFATRPVGRDYLDIIGDISSLAQTIPPIAVLALAVPFIGFGFKPTVLALFLYSLLPILRNTISGLTSVPPHLIEAARGMGMRRARVLFQIELPLSIKVIMAGIRTSIVINVGTATAGAVVGAGGLGTPIISGLVRENPAFVLEGALSAAFLAFVLDQTLSKIEQSLLKTPDADSLN